MKISTKTKVYSAFIVLMLASFVVLNEIMRVASIIIDTGKASGDTVVSGIGAILLTVPAILICGFFGIGNILLSIRFDKGDCDE